MINISSIPTKRSSEEKGKIVSQQVLSSTSEGSLKDKSGTDNVVGEIAKTIGTGKNAQNSIIYLVIKWAFISAVAITVIVIMNYLLFRDDNNKVPDITGDIKIIWEIVTPIITLALGYAFGKSER